MSEEQAHDTKSEDSSLPEKQRKALKTATRLEWAHLVYVLTCVVGIYLVMGNSQAMKAAWLEDMLAFIPPIAFLIARHATRKGRDADYPYGHHRAVGMGHLSAALALLAMGVFVVFEAATALLGTEHPTIGTMNIAGHTLWQGWIMIAVLAYTGIPNIFIGRKKIQLAETLHDRVLLADGEMDKDDWLTAGGAIIGILGVGMGVWWLDSAIALLIGTSVLRDGVTNMKSATSALLDVRARTTDNSATHPLVAKANAEVAKQAWAKAVGSRVRDMGHVLHAEIFVVTDHMVRLEDLEKAAASVRGLDWKLRDVVVIPVNELPDNLDTSGT